MPRHRTTTSQAVGLLIKKASQLLDARIDAAVVEYTEIMQDLDNMDFRDVESRIAEARKGGFPPEPHWQKRLREERKRNGLD